MTAPPFDPTWLGVEGVFGGFVLGRVVQAADAGDGFTPQAVTIHFLSAVRAGEVDLRVETLHRGRATASRRIELRQDGRLRVHAVASLVSAVQERLWLPVVDPVSWGDPEQWPPVSWQRQFPATDLFDVRCLDTGSPEGGSTAWVRLREPVPLGPHAVAAVFLDLLPPGLFAVEKPPYFVPTIEFTIHFTPGLDEVGLDWHLVTNRTVWAARGACVDESSMYDRTGRLVAQMRQGRVVRWDG